MTNTDAAVENAIDMLACLDAALRADAARRAGLADEETLTVNQCAAEWELAWGELLKAHGGDRRSALADCADFGLPQMDVIVWHKRSGWVRSTLPRFG